MFSSYSLGRLYIWLLGWSFVLHVGIAPLYKYGEYVYGLPRVNVTFLFVAALAMLVFFGLSRFLLSGNKFGMGVWALSSSVLVLWVLVLQIIQVPFLSGEVDTHSLLTYLSRTFISTALLFMAGCSISMVFEKNKTVIKTMWLISVCVYVYGIYRSSGFYIYLDGEQIYLMLSDAFVVVSIFAVFSFRSYLLKLVCFLITLVILFALLSRSAVLVFVLSFVCYILIFSPVKALTVSALSFFLILFSWDYILEGLGESHRFVRFFVSGEDSSFSARSQLFDAGKDHLKENWLLGQYMYDVVNYGGTGQYAHNYMSFWTAYGLGPVLMLVSLVIMMLYFMYVNKVKTELYGVVFVVFIANVISILVSKSYLYPYFWFAFGSVACYLDARRRSLGGGKVGAIVKV